MDDGAYLATRLVIEVARLHQKGLCIADLLADLSEPAESCEFRLAIRTDAFRDFGQSLIQALFAYADTQPSFQPAPENGDGWFLLRLSLHEPLIAINIESERAGGVRTIAQQLMKFLSAYQGELDLSPLASYLS